jgi:hypothetical protein
MSGSPANKPTQDDFIRVFAPLNPILMRSADLGRKGPAPGSRASREGRTQLGKIAWDLGGPANEIGLDHLRAWGQLRLQAGVQPIVGHLTLIRGALEGMSIARWLCDPAIGRDERVRRAAGVQLEDYGQRLRFERRMASRLAKPVGEGKTAQQRIDALERLLRKEQVKPIGMPSATDLFARYVLSGDPGGLAGESLYRLISGIAHAKVWSLFGISELTEGTDIGNGRWAVKIGASEELGLVATKIAMRVAEEALADLEWYGLPAK